jgi:YVTN family beta-propeller protein
MPLSVRGSPHAGATLLIVATAVALMGATVLPLALGRSPVFPAPGASTQAASFPTSDGTSVLPAAAGVLAAPTTASSAHRSFAHPLTSSPFGRVTGTLELANNTLYSGEVNVRTAFGPDAVASDPASGLLYIADNASNTTTVFNATTRSPVALLHVGEAPDSVLYDASNGLVYVANARSDNISIINGSSMTVLSANISLGGSPSALALDGTDGYLYVVLSTTDRVIAFDTATEAQVGAAPVGAYPDAAVYDPSSGKLFVANAEGGSVTILDAAGVNVTGAVFVGEDPTAMVLDPTNGYVFVADAALGNVTVLNGSNGHSVGYLNAGTRASALAFDPANGYAYLANSGSSNLTVINGTSATREGSIALGAATEGISYDSGNGLVYAVSFAKDALFTVNPVNGSVVSAIELGSSPDAVAFDPTSNALFVGSNVSDQVFVVNASTDHVNRTVPLANGPFALVFDAKTGDVYALESGSYRVTAINGSTDRVVGNYSVPSYPLALAVNSANGNLFVALENGNVTELNATNGGVLGRVPTGSSFLSGVAYDPLSGCLYAVNEFGNDVIVINASTLAVAARVEVGDFPDAIAYGNGLVFVANDFGGVFLGYDFGPSVTVINGSSNAVVGGVTAGWATNAVAFDARTGFVYTTSAGYPDSNLTVIDPIGLSDLGSFPVGRGADALAGEGATGTVVVANPASGSVSFVGLPSFYSVAFEAFGLPLNSRWAVIVNGTEEARSYYPDPAPSPATFYLSNGSYPYEIVGPRGYRVGTVPATGSLTISGADQVLASHFTRGPTYSITFHETGLPQGARWCVTIGSTACSSGRSLAFADLSPGTYPYSVNSTPGQVVFARSSGGSIPTSGELLVGSASVSVALRFEYPYLVTFFETGLTNGTSWSVTVGSRLYSSTNQSIVAYLPNGSYAFRVSPVGGYTKTTSVPRVVVLGGPTAVTVTFRPRA